MAKLKALYKSATDIPAEYEGLFVERNDQWEIDVEGTKSQADIDRLQAALKKERGEHRITKDTLKAFGDRTPESLQELEDELAELKAGGNPDKGDKSKDKLADVDSLVEARVAKRTRELEKKIADLTKQNQELSTQNGELTLGARKRTLVDTIRDATTGDKGIPLVPEALDDAERYLSAIMEFNDEGKPVTKEGVGVTPGLTPNEVLTEIQTGGKRPHWFKGSVGAGAQDGVRNGGPVNSGVNPFDKATWNATEASAIAKANPDRARVMIRQAKDSVMAREVFAGLLQK